jgi:hypothetical protein
MSDQFNEYEHEPQTPASASRNMGPPGKSIGADLIDGPEALPPAGVPPWPRISFWVGVILISTALAALIASSLLRRVGFLGYCAALA